jgi:hypothetical protein
MQKLIRTTFFATLLLLLGVSTAPAQTFELFAEESDIDPGSGNIDAQCLVQLPSSGDLVFFNSEQGGIFIWDGSALSTHRSASDLNGDVPDESNDFNRCDGVAIADGFVYFILRSSDTNDNYLYRTEAADAGNNAFSLFNGATSLAADASTVYIGGSSGLGAPSNGVFEISSDLSGSATEVASNSDVDPAAMALSSDGSTLYGFSSGEFGGGDFSGTVFSLDVSSSSPSFSVFTNPYAGNSPLTPDSDGGNIDDVRYIDFAGTSYLVVSNEPDSGWEWGTIQIGDQSVELLFTQSDLETELGVGGYDAFTAPLAANSQGEVFAASGGFGPDYIAKVSDAPPLPVEMAGFDAVQNGSSVELTWQTASETNNAGFTVQRETESGWTSLDFVESKVSGGTTTETTSYRYTVDQELDPGTHRFRLQQKDLDGSTSLSDVVTVDLGLDAAVTLRGPAPNPTTGTATLGFGVKETAEVTISVYNVLGQRVKTLYQGTPQADQVRDVTVDASSLSSGVYFVRLQADGQTRTERLTVVR